MLKKLHAPVLKLSILALVVGSFIAQPAFAALPDSLKVLLSDSRKATASNYTITHDQHSTGQFSSGDTLTITFPSGFNLSSLSSPGDFDFRVASTDETLQSATCGATDTVRVQISGQDIIFTACNSYTAEAAGSVIEIKIGTHATVGGSGTNQITNHSTAGVYTITSDSTDEDAKDALIAITDGVTLSATVDETLTFTVAGRTTGECDATVTGGSENNNTTATTVPFGTLNSDTFYNACQRLTIGTNASGGYSTTVHTTTRPTSGSDTIAKGTCDGSCTNSTRAAWNTATNNGYGYCMKDVTGTAAQTADGTGWSTAGQCGGGSQGFKLIARADASESPVSVMASTGATSTNNVSDIAYRISIGAGQAAGAYTTIIIYIATPTF